MVNRFALFKDMRLLYAINLYTLASNFHCISLVSISNYYIFREMYHERKKKIQFAFTSRILHLIYDGGTGNIFKTRFSSMFMKHLCLSHVKIFQCNLFSTIAACANR